MTAIYDARMRAMREATRIANATGYKFGTLEASQAYDDAYDVEMTKIIELDRQVDNFATLTYRMLGQVLKGWQRDAVRLMLSADKIIMSTMPRRTSGEDQLMEQLLHQQLFIKLQREAKQ